MFRRAAAAACLSALALAAGCGGDGGQSTLTEDAIYKKAYDAAIWATPILNSLQLRAELKRHGATDGDLAFLGSRPTGRIELQTLSHATPYVFGAGSLKAGPIVIQIPPASARARYVGSVLNIWDSAIEDFGPGGVDAGKGGRFVLMPPGSTDSAPAGHTALQSSSYAFQLWLRVVPAKSGDDGWRDAVEYAKGLRIYPLASAGSPPPTGWIDVSKAKDYFHGTPTFSMDSFEMIDEYVQSEPMRESDQAMTAALAEIGIVKGTPFAPDEDMEKVLDRAAKAAEEHLRGELENARVFERFWPTRAWGVAGGPFPFFAVGLPKRSAGSTEATLSLIASTDAQGHPLEGGKRYRLRVPPRVPVKDSWSIVLYSTRTRSIVDTEKFALSSKDRLQINKDGSVDLHFAPLPPAGRDANWIATRPGENFYACIRFHGPTPALTSKAWMLGNFEEAEK